MIYGFQISMAGKKRGRGDDDEEEEEGDIGSQVENSGQE